MTKRHHFAVHANIQAVHWQHNLNNVWEFAFGREYLTFGSFCQCFIASDHSARPFRHRLTPTKSRPVMGAQNALPRYWPLGKLARSFGATIFASSQPPDRTRGKAVQIISKVVIRL